MQRSISVHLADFGPVRTASGPTGLVPAPSTSGSSADLRLIGPFSSGAGLGLLHSSVLGDCSELRPEGVLQSPNLGRARGARWGAGPRHPDGPARGKTQCPHEEVGIAPCPVEVECQQSPAWPDGGPHPLRNVGARGRWWRVVIEVTHPKRPSGNGQAFASATAYSMFGRPLKRNLTTSIVRGERSRARTRPQRLASARANAPVPHPTSGASSKAGGSCPSKKPW